MISYTAKWKAEGKCISCGVKKDSQGVKCARCTESDKRNRPKRKQRELQIAKNRRQRLLSLGLCGTCGKLPRQGKRTCEDCLAYHRAYSARNPHTMAAVSENRRARKKNALGCVTKFEWDSIVLRQKGRCLDCGKKMPLEMDHLWPLAKGGCNYAFNIAGRCRQCNASKHATLLPGVHPSLFDRAV